MLRLINISRKCSDASCVWHHTITHACHISNVGHQRGALTCHKCFAVSCRCSNVSHKRCHMSHKRSGVARRSGDASHKSASVSCRHHDTCYNTTDDNTSMQNKSTQHSVTNDQFNQCSCPLYHLATVLSRYSRDHCVSLFHPPWITWSTVWGITWSKKLVSHVPNFDVLSHVQMFESAEIRLIPSVILNHVCDFDNVFPFFVFLTRLERMFLQC